MEELTLLFETRSVMSGNTKEVVRFEQRRIPGHLNGLPTESRSSV